MAAPALVALAHGSRDPRSAATIKALVDEVRGMRPDLRVEIAESTSELKPKKLGKRLKLVEAFIDSVESFFHPCREFRQPELRTPCHLRLPSFDRCRAHTTTVRLGNSFPNERTWRFCAAP